MEDFYKQFRGQLENRAEPAFEERDWNSLRGRLASAHSSGAATASWAWVSVPLLFLLLGTNAWWYVNRAGNQPLVPDQASVADTVFITKFIHQTDTVYVTKTIKVPTLLSSATLTPSIHSQRLTSRSAKPPMGYVFNNQNHQNQEAVLADTSERKTREFLENESNGVSHILPVELFPFGKLLAYDIPEKPVQNSAPAKKKSFRAYLPTIRPHGLQLGAIVGGVVAPSQNRPSEKGYKLGFQTNLSLTPHLQLWADATYVRTHYEARLPNEEVIIADVAPPTDDFVFRKAEVPQPSWQYSLGLKYQFLVHRRMTPFLGVGYAAVQELHHEVIYEYFNESTSVEWQFEKSVPQGQFQTGFLLLQTGVGYSFSRHWKGQLMLSHRSRKFDTHQIQWSFGSGLYFQF